MKATLTLLAIFCLSINYSYTQTTIAQQSFDGATPVLSYTTTGSGTTFTGSSGTGDRPASSTFYTSSNTAYGVSNGTAILTSSSVTGLASYTSKYFEFRLASWSMNSTGNGADAGDNVTVAISLDGGATFSNETQISGNSNAFWHYTTGTALATTVYDGNNAPTTFQPGGSGNRTTDGYSTVHIDLPASCTQAAIKITMLNNATNERWTVDDIVLIGTLSTPCSPVTPPTTQANSFSATTFCTSANLSWTNGNGTNRIVVVSTSNFSNIPADATSYPANSVYGSGSLVGAGNYVVYNGNANNVLVTGLTPATTYFVKIFEYNGTTANCEEAYYTSGISSFSFTTQSSCSTPQIRSILADACGSNEGRDEVVIIENGSSPLSISDISITFPTTSVPTYCNSGCGSNTLGNNASYVSSLNAQAGCTLFYYADPIPANAIIVVFTGNPPTFVFDYSSLCPSSLQYYVIFCNNPTDLTGRFANSGSTTRTLSIDFAGTNESVTYLPDDLMGNGSFVDFDDPGNPTYRLNSDCIYPLGAELIQFNGTADGQTVLLNWSTYKEQNLESFEIHRFIPENGTTEWLGTRSATGNTDYNSTYSFVDERPIKGANYYRLLLRDKNGEEKWSEIILVNREGENLNTYLQNHILNFSQTLYPGETIRIYTPEGQLVFNYDVSNKINSIPCQLESGCYLLEYTNRQQNREVQRVFWLPE